MNVAITEVRPGVIVGHVQRHIVSWLPLSQQIAESLQVQRNIRHDGPPRILFVVDTGRVEAPSGIFNAGSRVGPSMTDQLINAL